MTDQTDTVARKRRALIVVGVLLLALCAGGAYLALKGGKTGGATLGGGSILGRVPDPCASARKGR